MKLYVGRAQKFQILEFDDRLEPSLRTIPFGDQKNWGYLPYGKCLYAPCTDRLACYSQSLEPMPERDIPLPDGKTFVRPHQLLLDGDLAYAANTGGNAVYTFCLKTSRFLASHADSSRSWPNCLNKIDGNIWLLYNNCRQKDKKSDLVSLSSGHVIPEVGTMAHNVWKMQGRLWTSDTRQGAFGSLDGDVRVHVGGFLRGLALSDKFLFVGVSKNRKNVTDGKSGIAVFNASTLKPITFWPLESTCLTDGVFEIRLLGEQDLATSNPPLNLEV